MPGIFISYRRIDTLAWAGRLFADLRKSFGASQVFMWTLTEAFRAGPGATGFTRD